MTNTHPTLETDEIEDLRRAVVAEMGNVAARLAALKAGQNASLATMALPGEDEALTKLEQAQLHYDFFKDVLASFREGRYGLCRGCGGPITAAELKALPWADTCRRCAAR